MTAYQRLDEREKILSRSLIEFHERIENSSLTRTNREKNPSSQLMHFLLALYRYTHIRTRNTFLGAYEAIRMI